MTTETTTPKTLLKRMSAVMEDIEYVQKEKTMINKQYRAVSHDAVTALVRGALIKHGVFCAPDVESITTQQITKQTDKGPKLYFRSDAIVRLIFASTDNGADNLVVRCVGAGIDDQDKDPGKAVSSAIKRGLMKTFQLISGEDEENPYHTEAPTDEQVAQARTGLNEEQLEAIGQLLADPRVNMTDAKLFEKLSISRWDDFPVSKFKAVVDALVERQSRTAPAVPAQPERETLSDEQLYTLGQLLADPNVGMNEKQLFEKMSISGWSDFPVSKFTDIVMKLTQLAAKNAAK